MTYEGEPFVCAFEGCDESSVRHKWAAIKLQAAGWFFQRDGISWCSMHIPEWVGRWRQQQEFRRKVDG